MEAHVCVLPAFGSVRYGGRSGTSGLWSHVLYTVASCSISAQPASGESPGSVQPYINAGVVTTFAISVPNLLILSWWRSLRQYFARSDSQPGKRMISILLVAPYRPNCLG